MMTLIIATISGLLLLFLAIGIYVGPALGVLGLANDLLFAHRDLYAIFGSVAWTTANGFVLVAIPLFLLMGELLVRSGLADQLYRALGSWLNALPGGLLHTNIGACAIFSAVSGSSVATSATIGTVALPALTKQGYDERVALGSLAAGGTLGILIPPSISMILYGVLTETSIGRLFIAGIIPGIVLSLAFMLYIGIYSGLSSSIAPREAAVPWSTRWRGLLHMIPVGMLVLMVLGSIYAGFATPTEAAALGVVGAVVLIVVFRRASFRLFNDAVSSAITTAAMLFFIILGAFIFNFVITSLGVPRAITSAVVNIDVPPLVILLLIIVFYLVLGMVMEAMSMLITTIPIVFPVVAALHEAHPNLLIFDPIAFGILLVIVIEAALITPPIGVNLYVVQGIRIKPGSIADVIIGAAPFVVIMVIMAGIVIAFPQIALWLPNVLFGP